MPFWGTYNDLNRRYIVFNDEKENIQGDFRYRMLRENRMKGVIPIDIRNINGEYGVFFEVTDMESIDTISQMHSLSFEDVESVFKALILTSSELEKHFIEEESIVVIPELIFKNMVTNEYGFICLPPEKKNQKDKWQLELILFLVDHVNSADTKALEGLLEIYDMAAAGVKSYKTLYEKLLLHKNPTEEINSADSLRTETEEAEDKEETKLSTKKKEVKHKIYLPTIKESLAGLCILSGIVSIFVYIYLGWI